MKSILDVHAAAEFLNQFLEMAPQTCQALVDHRVPMDPGLEEHPSIVVNDADGVLTVGLLGVINGMAAREDRRVGAAYDDTGRLTGFVVVTLAPMTPQAEEPG